MGFASRTHRQRIPAVSGALDANGIELDYPAADSEWQPLTEKCYLCGEVFKPDALVLHIERIYKVSMRLGLLLVWEEVTGGYGLFF